MTVRRTATTLSALISYICQHNPVVLHTLEELLLQLGLCDLDFDSLVNLLCVSALVVGIVLNCGREKGVDEGRLSESRFASNLPRLTYALSHTGTT